jgi:hypothetical protein
MRETIGGLGAKEESGLLYDCKTCQRPLEDDELVLNRECAFCREIREENGEAK